MDKYFSYLCKNFLMNNRLYKPQAVIFDMDGLLVDSEPMWEEAQIKVFAQFGIEMTPELCVQVKGMKVDEAMRYWYKIYQWKNKTPKEVEDEIMDEMEKLMQNVEPLPGVIDLIDFYYRNNIPMAIASSSFMRLINIVVDKLRIRDKIDIIHSGEFEKHGKPAPDIFLSTAKKMNQKPENCVVFEDSVLGVQAGKAAGMIVVAVPYAYNFDNEQFNIADYKIKSLEKLLIKTI